MNVENCPFAYNEGKTTLCDITEQECPLLSGEPCARSKSGDSEVPDIDEGTIFNLHRELLV